MSDEQEHRPRLRVGGWIPAYREKPRRASRDSSQDGPDRLVTTPADGSGGDSAHDGPGSRRRRRVLLVAALVAAIMLTAGGVAAAMNRPGHPAPLVAPPAPVVSASVPVPTASPSASGEGGASSGVEVDRTDKALPATTKPSPSKTAATSKPTRTAAAAHPLAPGAVISLEPTDLPGSRLRHSNAQAWVDPISASSPALDRADARWIVHAGLADSGCVSFESSNYPGEYLRHQNSRLRRDAPDGSDLFKSDATFCPETAGSAYVVRLRSSNYPDRYLNRQDTAMYLADAGVAGETFTVRPPL